MCDENENPPIAFQDRQHVANAVERADKDTQVVQKSVQTET